MSIRVVLAEHYPLLLECLEQRLRMESDVHVLAACTSVDQLVRAALAHRPDVVVVDVNVSGRRALDGLSELHDELPSTRTVLVADRLNDGEALEACRLGVQGVVLKEMGSRLLVQCIRTVHAGGTWIEKRSLARALNTMIQREASERELDAVLTPRQMEIIRSMLLGRHPREIARGLRISEGTVKVHLHNIYERLGVNGRFELLLYAREKQLL